MPLVNCVECQKEISVTAASCPNCGSKKPFKNIKLTAKESADMSMRERRLFQKSGGTLLLSIGQKMSFSVIFLVIVFGVFFISSETDNAFTEEANFDKILNQFEEALRDPKKVRLLECQGINPWETKPVGWSPPTADECEQLLNELEAELPSRQ